MVAFVRRLRIFVAHFATHGTALLLKIDSIPSVICRLRGDSSWQSEHGSEHIIEKKK